MIRAQVCSVENTHVMGRNATTLPYMMGKKVEVHPREEKGQSNHIVESGHTKLEKILAIILAPSPKTQRDQMSRSRTYRDKTMITTRVC